MPTTLGKYTLGRELGSGVSCKVKTAKDDSNQRYAIKILKPSADFDELVQIEIEALTTLDPRKYDQINQTGHRRPCPLQDGEEEGQMYSP